MVGLSRLDDARSDYVRLLRDQPDFKEAKLQLALLNVAQQRFPEAEKLFREVSRPSDGDFRAIKGLVEVYAALHDWDRALALLKTETDRSPNAVALHTLFASTAVRAGRLELAIQQYQRVLQEQNGDLEIYTALGELYQRTQDFPTSLAMLEKARALAPNDWRALARLASVQQQAGLLPQAKTTYRQALRLGADIPDLLNNLAYLEAEAGSDLEEALTFVKKALSRAPSNPQYADTLGLVYLKQKNTPSALQVFRTLSHNHPQTAIFRYHLALALFQQGDPAGGHRELQAALAADPSLTATSKVDLRGTP
jgi:tetratricopeptide (TPR) repeat protein